MAKLQCFDKGGTSLVLSFKLKGVQLLEHLNKSLQSRDSRVSGMLASVDLVKCQIKEMKTESAFSDIFTALNEIINSTSLTPLKLPSKNSFRRDLMMVVVTILILKGKGCIKSTK